MAQAHPHQCSYPGCSQLSFKGRCEKHKRLDRQKFDAGRKDDGFRHFYHSREWVAVRDQHRAIEPLCKTCKEQGLVVAGEIVDHIIPLRNGGKPLDHDNLQTQCWSCHSRKSISEGSRFG